MREIVAPGDLLSQIIANNHIGIYYNLVQMQKMAVGLSPTVADVATVIQMDITNSANDEGYWLKVLDVPIQANGQFGGDLYALQQKMGKSPVRILFDLLEAEQANANPFNSVVRSVNTSPLIQGILLLVFLVGLYVTVRTIFRVFARL